MIPCKAKIGLAQLLWKRGTETKGGGGTGISSMGIVLGELCVGTLQ